MKSGVVLFAASFSLASEIDVAFGGSVTTSATLEAQFVLDHDFVESIWFQVPKLFAGDWVMDTVVVWTFAKTGLAHWRLHR